MNMRERIAELEDELEQRDRRIQDLKHDLDEANDLIERLQEHLQEGDEHIESWIQAFEMVVNDDGVWEWDSEYTGGHEWFEKYVALVAKWNKLVPKWNARILQRNVGRPLAASDAQREQALRLHKQGASLRGIADETGLGLRTVRTIVESGNGTDRTTVKHRRRMERIQPDPREKSWRANLRTRNALPKRINEYQRQSRELRKEAKGLA